MTTKAELRDVLTELGDAPPGTWRKDELEDRVAEWVAALAAAGEVTAPPPSDHEREVPPPLDDDDLLPATIEAGVPAGQIPEDSKWRQLERMADRLAQSRLVPPALYRRPDDVLLVLLTSHDLGIPATQALSKVHVIEGKPTIAAELMVALVLRDGHRIWPVKRTNTEAVYRGQRRGDPEVVEVTYSWADAENAKLTGKDNYKKHPRAMMTARCVSELCRVMFPDVLAGASYTPEELGAIVDVNEDGEVIVIDAEGAEAVTDRSLASDEDREEIRAMIEHLDDNEKAALREMWQQAQREHRLTSLGQLRADHVDAAKALILEVAPNSQPEEFDEAEIVPEPGVPDPDEDRPPIGTDDAEWERRKTEGRCLGCGADLDAGERSDDYPEYHSTCEPF